jgi:hypothetical protein
MTPRAPTTIAWCAVLAAVIVLGIAVNRAGVTLSDLRGEKDRLASALMELGRDGGGPREQLKFHPSETRPSERSEPSAVRTFGELEQALTRIRAARSEGPARAKLPPYPKSKHGDIFPELLADPVYAQLYATYLRANVERRYADFFATTSARPDAVAKLKDVLVQRQIAELEKEELIARYEVPASERGELGFLLKEKFDAEARQILGDVAFVEFQRQETTAGQRTVVNAFARRLSYSENPLQPAQAVELVEIMVNVTEPHGRRMIPVRKINDEVIERARLVLAPSQWQQLKAFRDEQDTAERIFRESRAKKG